MTIQWGFRGGTIELASGASAVRVLVAPNSVTVETPGTAPVTTKTGRGLSARVDWSPTTVTVETPKGSVSVPWTGGPPRTMRVKSLAVIRIEVTDGAPLFPAYRSSGG